MNIRAHFTNFSPTLQDVCTLISFCNSLILLCFWAPAALLSSQISCSSLWDELRGGLICCSSKMWTDLPVDMRQPFILSLFIITSLKPSPVCGCVLVSCVDADTVFKHFFFLHFSVHFSVHFFCILFYLFVSFTSFNHSV